MDESKNSGVAPQRSNATKLMTPELWAELRAASEGGESDGSLTRRFPVSRNTIKSHRRLEGWAPSQKAVDSAVDKAVRQGDMDAIVTATRGNVISMSSRKALDIVESNGTIDYLAEALKDQAIVSKTLMSALKKTIAKFMSDGIKIGAHQNEADVLNSMANAAKNVVNVTREIAGLRPGIPSTGSNIDEGLTIEERVIEPTKLPVDANGRAVASGE